MRTTRTIVIALLLAMATPTGCAGAGQAGERTIPAALRTRAAADLKCKPGEIALRRSGDNTVSARGCKREAHYTVTWALVRLCPVAKPNCIALEFVARLYRKAWKHFQKKQYLPALTLAKKFVVEHPHSRRAPGAWLLMGLCQGWLSKKEQSTARLKRERHAFGELIRRYPKSRRRADGYLYLAQTYSGHTFVQPPDIDCKKAIGLYKKAVGAAKRDWIKAQATGRIGQCYEQLGKPAAARTAYERVIRNWPKAAFARYAKDLLAKLTGRPASKPAPARPPKSKWKRRLRLH